MRPYARLSAALGGALLGASALVGCAGGPEPGAATRPSPSATPSSPTPTPPPTTTRPSTRPSAEPSSEPSRAAGPRPSDGTPRTAYLTIPRLDISGLEVVPYEGFTDDAPGTAIQDRGTAASPHGPRGGTGPGGIGNYQVTAHRLSSTRAFEFLPDLRVGDEVTVRSGERRYTYRVTDTRKTSFRSAASLRAQRAAVPGRPGVEPTRAMITLSTCRTPEDHAEGNYWSDEFSNPEHRIDKIGVLVRTR